MRFNPIIKVIGLAVVILLVSQAVYVLPPFSNPKEPELQPTTNENVRGAATEQNLQTFDTESLYLLINAYRKDHNLSPLLIDPRLENSATAKVVDMLNQHYFRHEDTVNQESWYLFSAAGYNYKKAGENISFSHNTPWQVFSGWVNSPTHNEQLLTEEYEDMGVAADCSNLMENNQPTCIVVLHLGLR